MKQLQEIQNGNYGSHILPFLWMKGEDNETIREELDKIEECGIKEICLESRPHPDFVGAKWWENLDFLVSEAKKRDMKLWILDDKRFPTGYANGGFEKHPELQKIYLGQLNVDIMGPCTNSAVLISTFMPDDATLLGVLAYPKPDGETTNISSDGVIDLSDNIHNGFVYFDLPEGAYRLFMFFTTRKGGGKEYYMNLIDSDSVRVLIDEVYEPHFERYKEDFGTTIAGFFSDEPELGNINRYPLDATLGTPKVRLPWSKQLEERLRNEWKDSFLENLPALWFEITDTDKNTADTESSVCQNRTCCIRTQYMEHLTDLVYTCFSSQLGKWCEEHCVEYIGHVIEDDNAHARLACSVGHYFKEMKGQHMAGIDLVSLQIVPGFTEKIHHWLSCDTDGEFFHFGLAKLGSSAAHIDPKKKNRALCEIFGYYGWAEGVSLMKWLTNHMMVRGINTFTPHAFSMSYPDPDCPPHFYARGNNPQFGAFRWLMKYTQRACHLLTSGNPLIDAAVLYHAESEWGGGRYQLYQKPMRALLEAQVDCDVIPVQELSRENACITNNRLVISEMSYGCLVLPKAECVDPALSDFVVYAAEQGLPIYAVDSIPRLNTHGETLPDEFKNSVHLVTLQDLAVQVKSNTLVHTDVRVADSCKNVQKDLRIYCLENEEGRIYMFFNENVNKPIEVEFSPNEYAFHSAKHYDPWYNTNEFISIESGIISIRLEPGEAQFFVLEKDELQTRPARTLHPKNTTALDLKWHVSHADALNYGKFKEMTVLNRGDKLPNLNGPEFDTDFTGFYRYDSVFTATKQDSSRYFLRIPSGGDTAQIFLNGKDLGYLANFPGRVEITDVLKNGENSLRIEFSTTLVWERKDIASTRLQIFGTGLLAKPEIEEY